MKKSEFIKLIADRTDAPQKEVLAIIDAFEDIMMEEIFAKEDSIRLKMGTFSGYTSAPRAARVGHNPKTGEPLEIAAVPAKPGQPKVKFSKAAKE